MYCRNCGAPLDDDALFCSTCGYKVQNFKTTPKRVKLRSIHINKKIFYLIGLAIGIFAVLCVIVGIVTESTKDPGYYNDIMWGTSYDNIKSSLPEESITSETEIEITVKSKTVKNYNNLSVFENYLFDDSGLYGVECDIFIPRGNPVTSQEIAQTLVDEYSESYGEYVKDVKGYQWETKKSSIILKVQKESVHIFFFELDTPNEKKEQLKRYNLDNYEEKSQKKSLISSGTYRSSRNYTNSTTHSTVSTEYQNALTKGLQYANHLHLSKKAIYDQLTSSYGEGFTADAAQYAINHMTSVDWNYNALQKAKEYQSNMAMSKSAIYDQLTSSYGEQFTASEAQYAIDHLN